jgi:E3 ubiquitin-protein ligase HECTD2
MRTDLHPVWRPELSDLAQLDPALARNLQAVLDYEGNIAEDISVVFQVDSDVYGRPVSTPLVPGGESRVVTKKTREEYVDLYVEYVLDKSIRKQFEPFARGFFNVCGGAALSLFRGEEIELLIRGSGDLDINVLRGTTVYENFQTPTTTSISAENPTEVTEPVAVEAAFPVVRWFWELLALAGSDDQRRVLRWITGSDRIPATGMGGLILRIQCLGDDCDRLPQARTCFNTLQIWNYSRRAVFVRKFWMAVVESGGFGMK